ncbi:MAG: nucleotidyl transferase AbiEii/AbiGii toxin family protein [Myxococcota bacterium]|nr:nucleotidyl transferase AbiEii/AbiGii toxin family protein [Myxococcota bacterium]
MTKAPVENVAASVRARLLARSKLRREDFQLVLTRYAGERFLYRLSRSEHAARFVLKGATLFTLWRGNPHRATRDLDLLGFGPPAPEAVRAALVDVLELDVEADGLVFDLGSLVVRPIREDQDYGGVRGTFVARLEAARIRMQVDVGFGDAITPRAELTELPTMLDLPAPRLRVYPRETVVAEKVEAMCQLGLANSRMKDFYDLAVLSRTFDFDGGILARALRATFANRGTPLPDAPPIALTPEFYGDLAKQTQWRAFVRRANAEDIGDLTTVLVQVRQFIMPVLSAAASGTAPSRWTASGSWSDIE